MLPYTLSTLSPGVYPISFTYTDNGCSPTLYHFVTVSSNTNVLVLNPAAYVCANTLTLNLTSLLTNPSYTAGTSFQVNGVPASTSTPFTFTATGIYTISAVNTNTSLNL